MKGEPGAESGIMPQGTNQRCARQWPLWLLAAACATACAGQAVNPAALNVPWTPLAPQTLTTPATGPAGGRILSVAVDPSDSSGNTVYLGTSGGVYKSTNAAATTGSAVAFAPATDRVAALGPSLGQVNLMSVGAVTVQPGGTGVVLAGTGDPTGLSDSLYGTGILRSTDRGNSWTMIQGSTDPGTRLQQNSFFGEAVVGFAWNTSMPNLVVAALVPATGAYAFNAGYTGLGGSVSGLVYSQDAGQTWLMATVTDGQYQQLQAPGQASGGLVPLAVVWNPLRRIFVAAIRYHGFYSSPDAVTWTRLAAQPGGAALNKIACPSIAGGSPNCPIFRAALTVQPGTGDMFAMATTAADADGGLWQDICAATGGSCAAPAPLFAKQIGVGPLETSKGVIAGASHALWLQALASGGDTLLFAGTQDLFRCSLAAGCTWRNATHVTTCAAAQVGPVQHGAAWVPGSTVLFFGTDRGLWRSRDEINQQQPDCSADDAAHFDNLNATLGPLTEVTAVAQDPADPASLIAGTGAAGTAGGSDGAWQSLLSGIGAYAEAGWGVNAGTWFATSGPGVSISACPLAAQCGPGDFGTQPVIGNTQVSGDGTTLTAPAVWTLDPEDPSRIFVGTCRVWRGRADGYTWGNANALSGMLDGTPAPQCQNNTQIRAMAATGAVIGRGDSAERVYVGLAGSPDGAMTHPGHILSALVTPASTAGSVTWRDLTGSPVPNDSLDLHTFNPGHIGISAIAVDPTDATGATVYVSLSGYGGPGFAESVNVPVLYGSTDAGQHWSNITNSLPNAPVNAVAVDPENPAIVYVGTDVGVFVTTTISQCSIPSQPCWAAYGTGLPAVRVTSLTTVDSNGEKWVRIGTKGRGVWQAELASTAIQEAGASATILPSPITYPAQAVGTVSSARTLTIRNTGQIPLILGAIAIDNSDFVAGNACPASLAAGVTCNLSITFAPTATGQRTATVTVPANVPGGVLTASLQGAGAAGGVIVLTPLRMDFGDVRIGETSPVEYLTVANTGTRPAAMQPIGISGPFALSANTCGSSLAVNTSCTVGIVFKPVSSGNAAGTLVATDDAGTQTALLSGIGQSGPTDTLSAHSLSFAGQPLGTTSTAQQVTVSNNGDSALTGIQVQASGSFPINNVCGSTLPGHSTCAIQVFFSPKSLGADSGMLMIADGLGQQTVTLNGTGTVPAGGSGASAAASPLTIDFGIQGLNSISAPQTLTIVNNGGTTLSNIAVAASQAFTIANNACAVSLSPGASCTVAVTFAPQTTGTVPGTVQMKADGLPAALNVPVTGIGADFQLSVQGGSSNTVTGGSSATYQLLLTPVGASAGSVSFTCSGAPPGSTCSANPASVMMSGAGATATIQVTITTVAASARSTAALPPWSGRSLAGVALASMLLLRRRGWANPLRQCCLAIVLGMVSFGLSGCGLSIKGGADGSSPGSGGSSQGIYAITVGGAAPGVAHTVTLNLTVE